MSSNKNIIFISHANPQDNDAAIWLASKLAIEGYSVWSDVTELFGGEIFWNDIEDAIRNHSAKFVILVSKFSQNADGVLNELQLAQSVEKTNKIEHFVIPIRLDDIPYSDFRVNIQRINAIDFHTNWADGLVKLVKRLSLDGVPKNNFLLPEQITNWFTTNYLKSSSLVQKPQIVGSNWLTIKSLPEYLSFFRIPMSEDTARGIIDALSYPSFLYQQLLGSFADKPDLQPNMPKWTVLTNGYSLLTKDFLDGNLSQFPLLKWQEGHNILTNMVKKAWDKTMSSKGLLPYQLSNSTIAWYLPLTQSTNEYVRYVDLDSKTRKMKLTGHSEKLGVYWNFAISVHPSWSRIKHLTLKSHVIFTEDGVKPISSKDRMHTMRRSFCRSWWNARWRGLLLTYLTYIAGAQDDISLSVSSKEQITISRNPVMFVSPITIEETDIPYKEITEENLDDQFSEEDFDESEEEYFDETQPPDGKE
jgi:hypothetical protein